MPSFVGDIVSGAADVVGSVVGGVADAVGSVTKALGPVGTIAAAYFGAPYLAPSGFAALEAPSILGGGMTGAGMLTSGSLGTALGSAGSMFGGAGLLGTTGEIGSSLLSTAGGIGTSSSMLTNFGRALSSGLSNFGSNLTSSFLPGESGGMPTGTSTFGKLSNLIKGGMNIYNALNYGQGQSPTAAQQNADPYAPYRQQAADKLNALMENPNLVYGLPGYRFAQEQGAKNIQRQAASTGQALSGNTLASLQTQSAQTAQNWFDDYVNKLTQQAGATPQNAVAGQTAYSTAADYQAKAEKARQTALLQGIMGAGSAVAGFFS